MQNILGHVRGLNEMTRVKPCKKTWGLKARFDRDSMGKAMQNNLGHKRVLNEIT